MSEPIPAADAQPKTIAAAMLPHIERLGPSGVIVVLVLQLLSTVQDLGARLEAVQAQLQAAAVAAAVIPYRLDELDRRMGALERADGATP
jgi:hypothetical protein